MRGNGPVGPSADPQLFLGRSIVLTLRGGLQRRYIGTLASVDVANGGLVVLEHAQEAVLQPCNGGLQLVQVGTLTVSGNDVADLVLVPQGGQFAPQHLAAAEQTPCTPQQTRKLPAPSTPHSTTRGQSAHPGHLSEPTVAAAGTSGAGAPAMGMHTPTHRPSALPEVTGPGIGAGALQGYAGAGSNSTSTATPASALSDNTWGTPDSDGPGSASQQGGGLRGLRLAHTPEGAEAKGQGSSTQASAPAPLQQVELSHGGGMAHVGTLGQAADLAAATPSRSAAGPPHPSAAAFQPPSHASAGPSQHTPALSSLAAAMAAASLGGSSKHGTPALPLHMSTTPVAQDPAVCAVNPFSHAAGAAVIGPMGAVLSGWDLARMGGMSGAAGMLHHASDLDLPQHPPAQMPAADLQMLMSQVLNHSSLPQPQPQQQPLGTGGMPAVASLLATLSQLQQQAAEGDQQLRLQAIMTVARLLAQQQQQHAAVLPPPVPPPLSTLGQISVPSASAAFASPALLAAQQQLSAMTSLPSASFPSAPLLGMLTPTHASRTPTLMQSPLPPAGTGSRGQVQSTLSQNSNFTGCASINANTTPGRSPLTQAARRGSNGGVYMRGGASSSNAPTPSGITMPKPIQSPGPASAAKLASAPVSDHKGLKELQHFLVERAGLASAGLMSSEEWCAVTGEALRRLSSLGLPLAQAVATLNNWAEAGVITRSQYEAMRVQLLLGRHGAGPSPASDPPSNDAGLVPAAAAALAGGPMPSGGGLPPSPPHTSQASSKAPSNAPTGRSTPARRISNNGGGGWAAGDDVENGLPIGGVLGSREDGENRAPGAGRWGGVGQHLGATPGARLGSAPHNGGVLGVSGVGCHADDGQRGGGPGGHKKSGEQPQQQPQQQRPALGSNGSAVSLIGLAASTPARPLPPAAWYAQSPASVAAMCAEGMHTPWREDTARAALSGGEWGSGGPSGAGLPPPPPLTTSAAHTHGHGPNSATWRAGAGADQPQAQGDATSRVLAFGEVVDKLPATLSSRATSVSSSTSLGNLSSLQHGGSSSSGGGGGSGVAAQLAASAQLQHPRPAPLAHAPMQMGGAHGSHHHAAGARATASPSASPAQLGHGHVQRSVTVDVVALPPAANPHAMWPAAMGMPAAAPPGTVVSRVGPAPGAMASGASPAAPSVTYASLGLAAPIVRGMADCGFRMPDAVQAHLLSHLLPPILAPHAVPDAAHPAAAGGAAIKVLCCHVPSCPASITALSAAALQAALSASAAAASLVADPPAASKDTYRVGALVVCPRREEAEDLGDMVRAMAFHSGIPAVTCVGGTALVLPPNATAAAPSPAAPSPAHASSPAVGDQGTAAGAAAATPLQLCVAVGTPGRVLDLLRRGVMDVSFARCVALIEAPSLLSRHFRPQINELATHLVGCAAGTQVVLLSPTEVPHTSLAALERALATAPAPAPAHPPSAAMPAPRLSHEAMATHPGPGRAHGPSLAGTPAAMQTPALLATPIAGPSLGPAAAGGEARGEWAGMPGAWQAGAVQSEGAAAVGVGQGQDEVDARGARDQDLSSGHKSTGPHAAGALAQFAQTPTAAGAGVAGAGGHGSASSTTPVSSSAVRRLNPFAPEFSSPRPVPAAMAHASASAGAGGAPLAALEAAPSMVTVMVTPYLEAPPSDDPAHAAPAAATTLVDELPVVVPELAVPLPPPLPAMEYAAACITLLPGPAASHHEGEKGLVSKPHAVTDGLSLPDEAAASKLVAVGVHQLGQGVQLTLLPQ